MSKEGLRDDEEAADAALQASKVDSIERMLTGSHERNDNFNLTAYLHCISCDCQD